MKFHLEALKPFSSAVPREQGNKIVEATLAGLMNGEGSGFFNTPVDNHLSHLEETRDVASKFNGKISTVVFIGIGGSSLGPIALLSALAHLTPKNAPKFEFFENPDPTEWAYRSAQVDWTNALVVVVTKSGTTFETLGLFALALQELKKARGDTAKDFVVAITDPAKGELRTWAESEGITTLPIAPAVGGRFSVFTPVGTLALELAGLSAQKFLQGAARNRSSWANDPLFRESCAEVSAFFASHQSKYPIHVLMPYTSGLKVFAAWWVQLWAESLGKNRKGYTPIAALGAVDQHSILQLLRDGPSDKVITWINVKDHDKDFTIPETPGAGGTFKLLTEKTLGQLLRVEFEAVQRVMTNQNAPHFCIEITHLSESTLGELMFFYCTLTAVQGRFLDVDPFDQPGVEEGKIYIRDALK